MHDLGLPPSLTVGLFDLDGVLTSTVNLHRKAWKQAFDEFLHERSADRFAPFTACDYLQYVDGRPRTEGVRMFLAARQIEVSDELIDDIAGRKNELFMVRLRRGEAESYPGSVAYLAAAHQAGLRAAVVTSSQNAQVVLDAVGLSRYFGVRVDGTVIAASGLRGKPSPDTFLAAAEALGVKPRNAVVFEDALAGVRAGRAGGFGYVVGVDRVRDSAHAVELRAAGADVVVTDLAELLGA